MKKNDWSPGRCAWFALCALLMSANSYYIARFATFSVPEGVFHRHALLVQTGAPILLSYLVARQSRRRPFLAALSMWALGVFAFYICHYQALLEFWADVRARKGLYTIAGFGDPDRLARGPFDSDLFLWTGVAGVWFFGFALIGWLFARCEFWVMHRLWQHAQQ